MEHQVKEAEINQNAKPGSRSSSGSWYPDIWLVKLEPKLEPNRQNIATTTIRIFRENVLNLQHKENTSAHG